MSDEPFDLFPGRSAYGNAGNEMLAAARDASAPRTLRAAQSGQPTAMGERLSAALSNLEAAKRSGDAEDIDICERLLDAVVRESREQRGASEAERTRNADGTYAEEDTSFDGGVRRGPRSRRPVPGMREETPGQAFRGLIDASRRAERDRGETQFGQLFG